MIIVIEKPRDLDLTDLFNLKVRICLTEKGIKPGLSNEVEIKIGQRVVFLDIMKEGFCDTAVMTFSDGSTKIIDINPKMKLYPLITCHLTIHWDDSLIA